MSVGRFAAARCRARVVVATLLLVAALGVLAAPAGAHAAVLKRGSHGAAVVRLQRKLRIDADGVFGRATVRAVRRFQRRRGLAVDGIVGPQTAAALRLVLARVTRGRHDHHGGVHLPALLARIARCESGGNPRAVSANGTYRGKYQFDRQTWHSIGGHGDPARAPERVQDRLALRLYRRRGTSPWPACG
jgi:hypothetical protein